MRTRLFLSCLTAVSALCLFTAIPAHAENDDDRMAGKVPVASVRHRQAHKDQDAGDPSPARQNTGKERKEDHAPEKQDSASVDFNRLEGLGMLEGYKDGGLGKDIWAESKRSRLIPLIESLPPDTRSWSMSRMLVRALLSETDPKLIVNDVKPEAGRDLLTVRIEKLVQMGAYPEAAALYSRIGEEPYSERLAHAGVIAMLSAGTPSLACLEERTVEGRFKDVPFWQQMKNYCTWFLSREQGGAGKNVQFSDSKILQSIADGEKYGISFNYPDKFSKFSYMERAVLFAEHRVDYSDFYNVAVGDVPSDTLGLAANDSAIPPALKLKTAAEQVRRGLVGADSLASLYKAVPLKNGAEAIPYDRLQDWQKVPYLFVAAEQEAATKTGGDPWPHIEAAFGLIPPNQWAALLPFAEAIGDSEPDPRPSCAPVLRAADLVLRDGSYLSPFWKKAVQACAESNEGGEGYSARLVLFADSILRDDGDFLKQFDHLSQPGDVHTQQILWVVTTALDNHKNVYDNPSSAYDKLFDLTLGEDYVMPNVSWMNLLRESRENRMIGQAILMSTAAFHGADPEESYPGVLQEALQALISVGLDTEARKLAVEAVLGLTEKRRK